jgi:hypothetical protein
MVKFTRKVFVNSRTGQYFISLPKKKLKKKNPKWVDVDEDDIRW